MEDPLEPIAHDELQPHWATDWSAQELTFEELNEFENVIADLYDWIARSEDSCEDTVKDQLRALPVAVLQSRRQVFYAAVLRYMVVELVMCCENNEYGTVYSKQKQLLNLSDYLVDETRVINFQLIDQELEYICSSEEAYPSPVPEAAGDGQTEQQTSMFQNFHEYTVKLYRKKFLTSLVPAAKAFDAYFGPQPVRQADTFYAVVQWLTYAHDEIYRASPEFQSRWPEWYNEISEKTAKYGKMKDKSSLRLAVSGRAAQKRMEMVDSRLTAFDKAIREGLAEAAETH